eukprot:gene9474-32464_t
MAQRYSYAQAQAQCSSVSMQLCRVDEICSNGVPRSLFSTTGDQWMPVLDGVNEWVEINRNDNDRKCKLHSTLYGKPSWGTNSEYNTWKAKNAQAQCSSVSMQLCRVDEICSNGVPRSLFSTTGDQWMPVLDGVNEWVEINRNDNDRKCKLHSTLYGKPSWGTNSEYNTWKAKNVGCCPTEPSAWVCLRMGMNSVNTVRINPATGLAECHSYNGRDCEWEKCTPGVPPVVQDMRFPFGADLKVRPLVCPSRSPGMTGWCAAVYEAFTPADHIKEVNLGNTYTYAQAKLQCAVEGMQLCKLNELCSGNIPDPRVLVEDGREKWVPILDSFNEWTDVNVKDAKVCKLHSPIHGFPGWGLSAAPATWKGEVPCCAVNPSPIEEVFTNYKQSYTYMMAKDQCSGAGMRLCTQQELCSDNVPDASVRAYKDTWVPVMNSYNEWVEVSMYDNRVCQLHNPLHQPPVWGTTIDPTMNWKGPVLCCSSSSPSKFDMAQSYSYAQAQAQCSSSSMRLCRKHEICSNGVPRDMFETTSDQWMPVMDGDNEWVEVNKNDNERKCELHSTLYGKPS